MSDSISCPFHKTWKNMMMRCYSPSHQRNAPSYHGVTVCEKWLAFSAFKEWMGRQDWKGKQLDKDILFPDNKIYSEETCVFVYQSLNLLLTNRKKIKGSLPVGVTFYKRDGTYQASIRIDNKKKHLGYFDTSEQAQKCYEFAKIENILRCGLNEPENIQAGLLRHCKSFYYYPEWRA